MHSKFNLEVEFTSRSSLQVEFTLCLSPLLKGILPRGRLCWVDVIQCEFLFPRDVQLTVPAMSINNNQH